MAIADVARRAWSKMFGDPALFYGETTEDTKGGHDIPGKLMQSVRKNYRDMEPFRVNARTSIDQFVGKYGLSSDRYSSSKHVVPVNKMRQMVKIYMRLLASDTPQAFVDTQYSELKPYAEVFRLALNRRLKDIGIERAMHRAVLDAMFSVGVIKTGIAEGYEEFEVEGEGYMPGEPFSVSVNINSLVIDMEADSLDEINFIGDRYKRPLAWIQAMQKDPDEAKANTLLRQSQMKPEDRPSGINAEEDNRLYAEAFCWDIYLPKQNKMTVWADGCDVPLAVYDWNGPEGGPYTLIGFDWVPGEVLPSAPGPVLEPLHNFINAVVRKIERQANRQKSLTIFQRGQDEDGKAIKEAGDGDTVGLLNPESVAQVSMGGADPGNHNLAIWADSVFDVHAGGLAVLGGTEPMSETAKQDQLLRDSANAVVDDMRRQVRKAGSRVVRQHAWYLWTDPLREIATWREVPGTDIRVQETFSPDVREGDFLDYNFSISPYSLQETTPQQLSMTIMQLWQQLILPNMQLYMQAGMVPNAVEMTRKIFDLNNIQFNEMFIPADPTMVQQSNQQGMVQPPQQPFRQTVNTRISRPGHTQKGNMNAIMSANAQMQSGSKSGVAFFK